MAKRKSNVRASNIQSFNFNPNLNITFIDPDEIAQYKAKGYLLMVSKQPNFQALRTLTLQEITMVKLLLLGNTPQQIAGLLSLDDSTVRRTLQNARTKLSCDNNIQLITQMLLDGLNSVLSQIG